MAENKRDGLNTLRVVVEIVAIFVAGCWAVWNFYYKEIYPKYVLNPQLILDVNCERLEAKNGLVPLRTTLHVFNKGARDAYVSCLWADIRGVMVKAADSVYDKASRIDFVQGKSNILQKHVVYKNKEDLGLINVPTNSLWLQSGEDVKYVFMSYVPEKFDLFEIETKVGFTKDGYLNQGWVINADKKGCETDSLCLKIRVRLGTKLVDLDSLKFLNPDSLKKFSNFLKPEDLYSAESYVEVPNINASKFQ